MITYACAEGSEYVPNGHAVVKGFGYVGGVVIHVYENEDEDYYH